MIRKILFTAACIASTVVSAQQTIIDNINFDEKTLLVGMASEYNTDSTYHKYNFYIDNPTKLNNVKLNLEYGYEMQNKVTDQNHFMIYAIKDRKIIDQWLVNPRLYNIFHNGVAYSFDADKLENVAKGNPLRYQVETLTFKNQKEYVKAKKELDRNQAIFLMYEPNFTYEGGFEVSIKKTDAIATSEQAEQLVRDLIKTYYKKEVSVQYALNERNLMDRSQFTLSIAGPKTVFDKFKMENAEIGAWIPEIYEAVIVKKK